MVPDYHIHTPLCKHATGSPAEYARAAAAVGIPELCFTDHAPNLDGVGRDFCMDMEQFPEYREAIAPLRKQKTPKVLFGIEADFYPGCERSLPNWLESGAFDIVLGSVHYMNGWGIDNEAELSAWKTADVADVWKRYFEMIGRMADTGLFDVVAHLDLPKKFGYRPPDKLVAKLVKPALDRIAAAGMAIEINTAGLRKAVREMYPSPMILAWARERDIPICFGSDAHEPAQVGCDFDKAVALARSAGYAESVRFRARKRTMSPLPD